MSNNMFQRNQLGRFFFLQNWFNVPFCKYSAKKVHSQNPYSFTTFLWVGSTRNNFFIFMHLSPYHWLKYEKTNMVVPFIISVPWSVLIALYLSILCAIFCLISQKSSEHATKKKWRKSEIKTTARMICNFWLQWTFITIVMNLKVLHLKSTFVLVWKGLKEVLKD